MKRSALLLAVLVVLGARCESNALASVLYWANGGSVYRSNLDGGDKETIFSTTPSSGYVEYVDLDPVAQKLYSYGKVGGLSGSTFVRRSNLDGTGLQDVTPSGIVSNYLYGFAIDSAGGKMYLGNHTPSSTDIKGRISRANLDGSGFELLPLTPWYPHDIEVDAIGAKVYYTDAVWYNGIRRANLDGTGSEDVMNLGGGELFQSMNLALDVAHGELYFTQYGTGTIGKANLDGSNVQTLVTGIGAFDIELDPIAGKLYWTTQTTIQRANLDGTGIETVLTLDTPGPWSCDSLSIDVAPVPEPCSLIIWSLIGAVGIGVSWRARKTR